jgi:DNA end-binding protein Ku
MAATIWKGHLTFALVSLPVKLTTAARGESVSFNQLHKSDNSRVKMVTFCQAEDKPVSRSELVKGYEYEKDKYVVIEEEEIKKVAPKSAKTMEILEFVKSSEIDPVYFESSYYLSPDGAGEKPYALLFKALEKTGYAGLARVTMHNREHIVILRPAKYGILMHTMYYQDEVRKADEFRTDTSLVKDKELELAQMVIDSLAAPFDPEKYHDTYRDNLMALVQAKIAGQDIVEMPAPAMAPVIDIMEALKLSLAAPKKPPVVEKQAEPAAASAEKGKRKRTAAAQAG